MVKDDLIDHIRANTATDAPMHPNGTGTKVRVLLADDHTILRAGLKMMLNAQPDIVVAGEASDGRQAITEALRLRPDVVLMDITMPECNGIEATKQIKRVLADVKVLVLTMHENEEYLFQMLRAGASGYMLKEAADTELISAIRVVCSGRFYLSPSAQTMMVSDYLQRVRTGEERDSYSALTEREREILKLVAEGYTNGRIARELWVTEQTVKFHLSNTYRKLGVANRTEASRYAHMHNLTASADVARTPRAA
jgi:two-component system response regulator NreC